MSIAHEHASAESTVACTDPAALRLVADYIAFHDDPTPEGIAALFTPDFIVFGSSITREGVGSGEYLKFLQTLKGTRFRQDTGTSVQVDEEGRLVLRWTLTQGEARLAGGVDWLSVREGRICKIVGVY
jgi:hypothetical protein